MKQLLGRRISEEELNGEDRAKYGAEVIKKLSKSLSDKYGKGFSTRVLYKCQQFYKFFPEIVPTVSANSADNTIVPTVSAKLLSWSRYENLIQVYDEEARDWYAMIDMLASTGMRVGEMVLLNRDDIDFSERECVVFGKGDKERIVYFDAKAKLHLQEYLDSRTDDNPGLFVTLRAPYERIQIGGIEHRLREMGKRLNITKVHPHKFRRTLATMAIDKGMPA